MAKTVNIEGVGKVNFPDDFTPERIKFTIENEILPKLKADTMRPEKPNALVRFGRGMTDIGQGVKQLGLMAKDAVTGGNEADQYTQEKTQELGLYERGRGPDAGFDGWRLGGNIVASLPAAVIPGGAAASMPVRMASGAAQGAAGGAAMFTPEGESKTGSAVMGGLFGAAFPALAAQGQKAFAAVAEKFRGVPVVDSGILQAELAKQLDSQGIDYRKLTQNVRDSLLVDAKKAISTGGSLSPEQLARKADIESVGAKGTQAAVTRNPKDWRTMQNLRGVDDVGEGIAQRQSEDAAALTGFLSNMRTGKAATPLEAGESAINALRSQDDALRGGVDNAYGMARDSLGRAAPMDTKGFSEAANTALDTQMLGGSLPAKARKLLNDISSGKIPFNVNTAVQADKVLSQMQRGAVAGDERMAIGLVRDALNKAGIADNVGEDAKRLFDAARAQARERFQIHERIPGMKAAIDGEAPDDFIRKFVIKQDAGTLKETVSQLRKTPEGSAALADIKGQIFDDLLLKSTGATNVDDVIGKPFSGVKFSKALDAIPVEKLHQLFTPSEIQSLRTLQRASKYLTEEVPFSDVNHSKTAAAMANLLQKIGNTPMLNAALAIPLGLAKSGAEWTKSAAQRKAAAEMLMTSAAQGAGKKALPAPVAGAKLIPGALAAASQQPDETDR